MSFSVNRTDLSSKSDIKKINLNLHEASNVSEDYIPCFSHQKPASNICLFSACNDPVLCPKCISAHNQSHISKCLPIQDVLFDKRDSLQNNVENILNENRGNLNYFQRMYDEKYHALQDEIGILCKAARETFLNHLNQYQERALGLIHQQYDKISSSMNKMQNQLDQQRGKFSDNLSLID